MRPKKTPRQTAEAILRAYDRAQGKHPRSHTAANYRDLAVRLAPVIARAFLALSRKAEEIECCKGLAPPEDCACERWDRLGRTSQGE